MTDDITIRKSLRESTQFIVLFLISVAMIAIGSLSRFLHEKFIHFSGVNSESGLPEILKDALSNSLWIGMTLLIGGAAVFLASYKVEKFFKNKISPIVTKHVDRLSYELEKSGKDTKTMLSAKLLENVIATSDKGELRSKLKLIHEKAYGNHCSNERSLYSAFSEKLSPFLEPETPHRSEYHQTVTVRENGEKSIVWQEVCSYKLHTISLENPNTQERKPVDYELKFCSIVNIAEVMNDKKEPSYKLSISVDDEIIFDSLKDLEFENGVVRKKDGIECVEVTHNDQELVINVNKKYAIKNPWTEVEIKETSIIYDDYFISSRQEPTCGAKITMNLPDDWTFELIRFGHPKDWTIHQHPTNTLSAWTNKWLMPGITFFCKWQRPMAKQLELKDINQK